MTVKTEKSPGFCLGCDYPLNGLTSHRCPECGREFDPADPHTINLEVPIGQFGRFCMKPFGWGMPIFAFLYLLLCFWETRVPLGPLQFPFASKYVGAFLWILWMTRVMLRLGYRMRFADTNLVVPGGWRLAWLVPFLVVLAITLIGWDLPVTLGFKFSRTALEKVARTALAAPGVPAKDQWAGIYKTKMVELLPTGFRGVQITVAPPQDAESIDSGFAYCPDGNLPPRYGKIEFEKISDQWYAWWQRK